MIVNLNSEYSSFFSMIFFLFTDRDVKIIGSMPGLSFVRHLINNIIFHGTTNQLGRPDLFITMPGQHYEVKYLFKLPTYLIFFSKNETINTLVSYR